jgi:glycerol-3-phosphate acyltransferase PlsX
MEARIALDAMGGDNGAVPNVHGAFTAVQRSLEHNHKIKIYLVGRSDDILEARDRSASKETPFDKALFDSYVSNGLIEIIDCEEVVDMDESPATVVRKKRNSSMAKCYQLVKEAKADAMISAGNSGAIMAYGIALLGRISGVRRPAILCHFPSKTGVTILLDGGANVDCNNEQLFQFAMMGSVYFKSVFEKKDVRVSLLNIGSEEGKGNELVKTTAEILKEKMPEEYKGYVEGRDVLAGKADVIVCDGFVGNVVLKTAEGVAQAVRTTLKQELSRNPIWGLGAWLAKGGFSSMSSKLDYREYGAAPLIGLNGLGLVAHGSSDAKAISSAIRMAELYVRQDLMKKLHLAFEGQDLKTPTANEGK